MNPGDNSGSQPYLPDVGIIGLVPDRWGDLWMPRQHVLTRLGRYFDVLWVDRMREWRDLWLYNGGGQGHASLDLSDSDGRGFSVYRQERWLPKLYRPSCLAQFTFQQRLRRARRMLRGRKCTKIVLYNWRPEYEPALDLIAHDLSVYHIDDEYSFSTVEKPLDEAEKRLISRVNQVFIHSPALLEKKGNINPHTLFVPNGVDYRAYATPVAEPPDLVPIARPRVGYIGSIKRQLDWPLLCRLASQHGEWSFVFVGPEGPHPEIKSFIEELRSRRNVHFLGCKSVCDLPGYAQHFDVCIMPYRMDDYTKYIYPLKLHEYLATGRPVVASPIRTLLEFGHVITFARTPGEWSDALEGSLSASANSRYRIEARKSVARMYDWDGLVQRIAHAICRRLGPAYLERFRRAGIAEAAEVDVAKA